MICPVCSSGEVYCPKCFCMYQHGIHAVCVRKECEIGETPKLKCVDCGMVVEENLKGVISAEMELIPYEQVKREMEKEEEDKSK